MDAQRNLYAANRQAARSTQRLVVEVSSDLLSRVDDWGVAAGMTSRRETVENLLSDALGMKAAGGSFGDQAPAAGSDAAAR
ncbi:hypothetical protein JI664_12640 [Rhodobacter sp. NTK016B]|uniref:hypothetical protein n=1 Tax=Rhodobacter sp. NTK016B TaxID=2759676 RepID=UPI001A8C4BCE|nr:hypothetical protein [Rhodobacter sp. NTK016B]MBN8292814.1 hypothetical protein [Rhodobacter sp. NTK016B]